jgi:hypothetical protein
MSDWPKAARIPGTDWAAAKYEKPTVRRMLAKLQVGESMRLNDCAPTTQQRKRIRMELVADKRFRVIRAGHAFMIVRVA